MLRGKGTLTRKAEIPGLSAHNRSGPCLLVAVAIAALLAPVASEAHPRAAAPARATAHSRTATGPSTAAENSSTQLHLIPGYSQRAVPECGVLGKSDLTRPGRTAPTLSPTSMVKGSAVDDFVVQGNTIYVLSGSTIRRYALDGALQTTIPLPWRPSGTLVVDSSGNMYVVHAPYDVLKLGPLGNHIYLKHFGKPVGAIFGHQSSKGWLLGVVTSHTQLFTAAGAAAGHTARLSGGRFADAGHGDIVADN